MVVDFGGFKGMVDAIGGVDVCLPHAVNDTVGHITLPAGTHKFSGTQALNYVRERHDLGNGSDIGRMKRQQAFIASMAHQAVSANTLANPIHLSKFLDAATKSLTLDSDLAASPSWSGWATSSATSASTTSSSSRRPGRPTPAMPTAWSGRPRRAGCGSEIPNDQPLPKSLLSGLDQRPPHPGCDPPQPGNSRATARRAAGGAGEPRQRPVRLMPEQPRRRPAGARDGGPEPDWQRRRRLAEVFGDVLPETTSDERDPEAAGRGVGRGRRTLAARQVPPHHG